MNYFNLMSPCYLELLSVLRNQLNVGHFAYFLSFRGETVFWCSLAWFGGEEPFTAPVRTIYQDQRCGFVTQERLWQRVVFQTPSVEGGDGSARVARRCPACHLGFRTLRHNLGVWLKINLYAKPSRLWRGLRPPPWDLKQLIAKLRMKQHVKHGSLSEQPVRALASTIPNA